MTITLSWVADSLWINQPYDIYLGTKIPLPRFLRKTCVGTVKPTKRGTYWAVHFYMGNVRTALPTEQEAKDLLMLLARSHYGVA
jgi:hypothetical protein